MVLQSPIGLLAAIEIEPAHAPVLGADNEVVAAWVDGDGRDPLHTRRQLLHELLLRQIVQTHICTDEESKHTRGGRFARRWVATKKIGFEGWNARASTRPLLLLNGHCDCCLLS